MNIEDQVLFHGKNLVCSYQENGRIVLIINEIIIPKGKVVFLLGASGSGKSTLLETLGLMNRTLVSGTLEFYISGSSPQNLNTFWSKSDVEISSFRKENFSFIFQQTNLMENFTAYENVCISGMIKGDVILDHTLISASDLMERVKLPKNEIGLNKMPVYLSGGQRQRLSFVRALSNKSSVIFCDEPTGNLDEANANELMEVIKEETRKGKTAIIVSHDINLALKYADVLMVLTKNPEKGFGELNIRNIHERITWEGLSEIERFNFRTGIKTLFSSDEVPNQEPIKEEGGTPSLTKSTYTEIFLKREFNSLLGKKRINIYTLLFTLILTFLAIGFANGSLNYLNTKMNSAFVNLISFKALLDNGLEMDTFLSDLNDNQNKNYYQYKTVSKYLKAFDSFIKYRKDEGSSDLTEVPITLACRTVNPSIDKDLIDEQFLSDDNFIAGSRSGFSGDKDFSIIVTEDLLKECGYPSDAYFIYYEYFCSDTTIQEGSQSVAVKIPIPIRSIVKELPDKQYLLWPEMIYAAFYNDETNPGFSNVDFSPFDDFDNLTFFIDVKDSINNEKIENEISSYLESLKEYGDINLVSKADSFGYKKGFNYLIKFSQPGGNYKYLDEVFLNILELSSIKQSQNSILRTYNHNDLDYSTNRLNYQDIAVYFKELDYVGEFAEFVKSKNKAGVSRRDEMKIDDTKVKEKKNFLFLSKVTNITSYLLIFFSTVAISMFIFFLLQTHLQKVQMNLGTFKAIGLPDKKLRHIYFRIIFKFLLIGIVISLILAFGLGELINQILLANVNVEDKMKYFILERLNTVLAFSVILLTTLGVSWATIRIVLRKSPGDLIYNR